MLRAPHALGDAIMWSLAQDFASDKPVNDYGKYLRFFPFQIKGDVPIRFCRAVEARDLGLQQIAWSGPRYLI